MVRYLSPLLTALLTWTLQQAQPDTEVFLAPLTLTPDGLVVGRPLNITNSPGYDNQPSFTPDGGSILYASIRGDAGQQGRQPDIFRYDLKSGSTVRLTRTDTGEYSPTVTPDGRHLSVVRVEADGTQRLWRFGLDGANPELVLADIKPVGYHAWIDAETVALFILGDPPSLHIADIRTGRAEVVSKDIGRSLQRVPGGGISFVTRERPTGSGSPELMVRVVSVSTIRTPDRVVRPVGTADPDLAWTPDGRLLMADKDLLYSWRKGQPDWKLVTDLSAIGLKGVSRLAISPKGDWIAVVTAKS